MSEAVLVFTDAIRAAGLTPPQSIEADGELHRFASSGKPHDLAGWYVLHLDDAPVGVFGCFRSDITETWHADVGRSLTEAERDAQRRVLDEAKRKREQAKHELHAEARERAAGVWAMATPAPEWHSYLARKGVQVHGLRVVKDGRLVVPVCIDDEIHSLQYIDGDGKKRFLTGGRIAGGYYAIGKARGVVCIAEGFATGAAIHEATGHAVAVAFNCGNLEAVARRVRERLPRATVILCADDDVGTDGNPGLTHATAAARAISGHLAVPDFGAHRPDGVTDFNDLLAHRGADAVRTCIAKATGPGAAAWAEPLPLLAHAADRPYPVAALPGAIGDAVREVTAFVQCPVALAACSALSALSVATQGIVNVRRGPDLEGPTSLYLMAVAESGERKSETDKRFSEPLRVWEAEEAERAKPDLARMRAELAAWNAEHEAVELKIKEARKKGTATDELRDDLEQLEADKPVPVRVPRVLLESETAESLAWNLAKPDGWPSGGILSSEAGVVLGGHAMRSETMMQSLALLNKLWSGEAHRVGRRTSEQFMLTGARLTMGLAVQPETLQAFFDGSRGLARGTGFVARFLIAWPASTQGTRLYREPPSDWPGLTAYKVRLRDLLATRVTMSDTGQLSPPPLDMSPPAFALWREFHDKAERELRRGGELADVRDIASKAAENVARVAALFHMFEHGPTGSIGPKHLVAATEVVTWHVFEARRLLCAMALPKALSNAAKLDAWLQAECLARSTTVVPMRDVRRLGPGPVRQKAELLDALKELTDAHRARVEPDGRTIGVNPALLKVG